VIGDREVADGSLAIRGAPSMPADQAIAWLRERCAN
jgi:hypothetical protein